MVNTTLNFSRIGAKFIIEYQKITIHRVQIIITRVVITNFQFQQLMSLFHVKFRIISIIKTRKLGGKYTVTLLII